MAAGQLAGHLIDGKNAVDGNTRLHRFDETMMVIDVEMVARLDNVEAGAKTLRLSNAHSGLDAEALRFITCGNGARGIGHHGGDNHRFPPQLRMLLLLDRGKVGVEINKKKTE